MALDLADSNELTSGWRSRHTQPSQMTRTPRGKWRQALKPVMLLGATKRAGGQALHAMAEDYNARGTVF